MKWSPRCVCSQHSRTASMRCHRVLMIFISLDSNGVGLPSSQFCNVKNNGTVDLLSRPSVLRFAPRCCISHFVSWSPNSSPSPGLQPIPAKDISPSKSSQPCTAFLLGLPGNACDANTRSVKFASLGPWSMAIELYLNQQAGFQHPTQQRDWFAPCLNNHAPSHKRIDRMIRTGVLESEQSHTQQELPTLHSRLLLVDPGRSRVRPSWAPASPSSWPEVLRHLACRVSGVRDPQDHAPFALQSSDTLRVVF